MRDKAPPAWANTNTNANATADDATAFEHASGRKRAHEAARAEDAVVRGAANGEREALDARIGHGVRGRR